MLQSTLLIAAFILTPFASRAQDLVIRKKFFKYSKAMKESGLEWGEPTLTRYRHKTKKPVKGTRMAFSSPKIDGGIANVIAFFNGYEADGAEQKSC